MLALISPAKNLDFESPTVTKKLSQPNFQDESVYLIEKLRKLSPKKIGDMMKISPVLAELNVQRYHDWTQPFDLNNAKQAALMFNGEVYWGLDAKSFSDDDFEYSQNHLRILSGLHGLLRPLDLIQPYRLEMGSRFAVTPKKKNLYLFWENKIHDAVKTAIQESGSNVLLNLASTEYFKAVKADSIETRIVTPQFKDLKNGEYKSLMAYAKRARGFMAAYMIKHQINDPEDLKNFDTAGYIFNEQLSSGDDWVFTRDKIPAGLYGN